MNAKQFAWAYLIKNGIAFLEESYYGGYILSDKAHDAHEDGFITDADMKFFEENQWLRLTNSINHFNSLTLEFIRWFAIDWEKTGNVESDFTSEFNGTFSKPTQKEKLVGTLILKNGIQINYTAEPIINDVFEQMAKIDELKTFFAEKM